MKKHIFARVVPFLLCVCCFCIMPSKLKGQTTVLSQSFNLGVKSVTNMNEMGGFDNWTFDNCYATADPQAIQIGSGDVPCKLGYFVTPPIGVEGNVLVLVTTKQNGNITGNFKVSVMGAGTVAATAEYTVGIGTSFRPSAILIKGCLPSTRIKIEDTRGKFYVLSIKIYAISDAIFYESFNYFVHNNKENEFAYSSNDAVVSLCDNYSNVEFENTKVANGRVFLDNIGHFTFPTLYAAHNTKALLSFKTALVGTNRHGLNITASEGVKMGTLDSNDISNLQNAYNGELTDEKRTWFNHSIILTGLNSSSSITIEGRDMHLDDVKLTPIPDGLDQSKDNTAYIEANAGEVRTVTLSRSLTPNVWCPLCLPFDVTPEMMAAVAGTCEFRTFSSVDTETGIFKFNSVEGETTIEAGTPFLIKTSVLIENPTFTGVTIRNTDPVKHIIGDYQFVGIYSPTYLKTDGTNLFLGTDGNLYKPGLEEGYNRLGGMRAYFVVPAGAEARVAIFDEPDVTRVDKVVKELGSPVVYNLFGRPASVESSRGIVISNGRKWLSK